MPIGIQGLLSIALLIGSVLWFSWAGLRPSMSGEGGQPLGGNMVLPCGVYLILSGAGFSIGILALVRFFTGG